MNPDDIKRSISDLADRVLEGSKQIGTQAQLQVQLRKQQVEYERRIHELGKKSYDWYRTGTMIVTGPVPPEVSNLCAELDGVQAKIRDTERLIEEAKAQSNPPSTPAVNAAPSSGVNPNQAVIVPADNASTTRLPDH
jgi:hypothetical protein